MNSSTIELVLELVPIMLLGITVYQMLLSAGFHNSKYLR